MRIKKGKHRGLSIVLPLLIVAFFVLPVLFPDIAAKHSAGEALSGEDAQQEGLPVVASRNPLSKYFKKLSNFYLGKNKRFSKKGYALDHAESEMVSMLETQNADPASKSNEGINFAYDKDGNAIGIAEDSAGNLPSFMYAGGKAVRPTADGYYIEDTFYANGTFPQDINRREIEKALSKYHKTVAEKNGLEATYIREPDGSLQAVYLSKNDLADMIYNASKGNDPFYTADAGRYTGARVAPKASASGGSNGSSGGAGGGFSDAGPMGDFASRYDGIYNKISDARANMSSKTDDSAKQTGDGGNGDKHESAKMKAMTSYLYTEPSIGDEPSKSFTIDSNFKDAPIVFEKKKNAVPLESVIIDLLSSYEKNTKGFVAKNPDGSPMRSKQYKEIPSDFFENPNTVIIRSWNLMKELKEHEKLRVFALDKKVLKDMPQGNVVSEYLRPSYSNFAKQRAGEESFKEVFYERKGLKNILEGVGISEAKRKDIEKAFEELDAKRSASRAVIKEAIAKNPHIKDYRPTVLFFLGSDKAGNPVVATPNSFAYPYAPGFMPAVLEKGAEEGKIKTAYKSVELADFEKNYLAGGPVVVTTNEENKKFIESKLNTSVVVIPDTQLTSSNPELIADNIITIGKGILPEIERRGTESQKAAVAELRQQVAMKKAVAGVNKEVGATPKKSGVNATTDASNSTQGKGPLRAPKVENNDKYYFDYNKKLGLSYTQGAGDMQRFYNPKLPAVNVAPAKKAK